METATEFPSVALLLGERVAVRGIPGLRTPSRAVFEWVRELLGEADTALGQLDCIAFGAGPGSFTGVRVAVALAQSLGYSSRLPVCPVSTLAALAAGVARNEGGGAIACCLDAHMGEVYFGAYSADKQHIVRPLTPDVLVAPEAVTLPGQEQYLAVGPGWAAYPRLVERLAGRLAGVESAVLPSAIDVAWLARGQFQAGRAVPPAEACPNYLRERVASAA